MQENQLQGRGDRGNNAEIAEIARKICGNYQFKRIRNSSTLFHLKVRKPNFKLRKALFKRGLERNRKNKNVLEFDVEKIRWDFFLIEKRLSF